MKKRVIGVVTAVLILLLVCNVAGKGFFAARRESTGIYGKITDSFQAYAAADDSSSAADRRTVYPDYYGGSYIDDSGKLVVLTTDMSDLVIKEIRAEAGYDVAVESCPVSLNELQGTVDTIADHFDLLKEQGVRIATVSKDIKTGKVIVSVIGLDAEKEAKIRALADYQYLEFQNTDSGFVPYTELRA